MVINTSRPTSAQLQQLTNTLLTTDHPGLGRDTVHTMYALLCRLAGIADDELSEADQTHTKGPFGCAISPIGAARCVLDPLRTKTYLLGVEAALNEAFEKFPDEPIELLYAGSGPFATLITTLVGRFNPDRLRVSLLDIHQRSIDCAKKVFQGLGLDEIVTECLVEDAITFEPSKSYHVIITETMQQALTREPQVAITANLGPHLKDGGFFVPQQVTVDVGIVRSYDPMAGDDPTKDAHSTRTLRRTILGRIIELTPTSAPQWRTSSDAGVSINIPATRLPMPAEPPASFTLEMITGITVHNGFKLGEYQCELTIPVPLRTPPYQNERYLEVRHEMGLIPKWAPQWI